MKLKFTSFLLISILLLASISAAALELDDFDKNLLVRVFKDVNDDDLEYMARLGLDSKDISLILYYYSNSDKRLDRDELDRLVRNRERISEFHRYYGLPQIIFDDDLVRFRHPKRDRHFPPLDTKKYDKKYEFKGGTEIIKVRGNNYDYKYNNKRTGVEEKIEIKNQKYEYYYKDRNMIEMLDVHHANNKYSYYYKNLNTGRTIKKSGRGREANKYNVYEELKEKYNKMEDDDDWDDDHDDWDDDDKYDDDDWDEDENDDNSDNDDNNDINVKLDLEIDLSDLFN
ncbi:hypothetical protein C7954_12513 [Halanaerobium congolense]|uniref:Uncharacterized protein n=1 Tax=Halanaerobium congolense TaxID=54121 RepID=A0A4R8G8Q6_9FIRM|nr:hypothetical protein [Halanaerobium congolense]TDX41790.1 hypothetical protein C7954_12513 [Halanaerobium congolense]